MVATHLTETPPCSTVPPPVPSCKWVTHKLLSMGGGLWGALTENREANRRRSAGQIFALPPRWASSPSDLVRWPSSRLALSHFPLWSAGGLPGLESLEMENTDVLVREDMNKDAEGKQERFNRKNELDNQKFDMLKLPCYSELALD